jgi:hypothetical protein
MTNTQTLLLLSSLMFSTLVPVAAAQDRGPAGTVTLSRPDYDRLLDLASRQPRPPDGPPLPAALTRADVRVRVAEGIVRATMTVDGEVLQSGTVKVPLISNATLLDARIADRPLPLVAEGHAHVAVLAGPAPFSATLEWGSTVTTAPGKGSFVLPVPPAGSVTATFDMPGEQSDLRVSPGLVLRRTSANGRTLIEATLDPGTATQVSWSSREPGPTTATRDVRLLSDVKSLVTIGDADVRLLSLVDVTIVQGEPAQIDVQLPAGYELAGVTGATLERSEPQGDRVSLFVSAPARRRHQFLLNLERSSAGGSLKLETAFPTVAGTQREAGQVAVEGLGTLEISAIDVPGLRRIDVREVDPAIVSATRQPLLTAFRYQRTASGVPSLALNVTRFPDAAVLAAIADRAVATTLLTTEGRALTEISLVVRNRAQAFMKVALPAGATMLSVDIAGSPAKPVEGADGMRVPLLRPGFRPDGPYTVAFVYLHDGTPFAKKGERQMTLPKMDVPISVVEWELFVPDRYRVDKFSGSAIAASLIGYETSMALNEVESKVMLDGISGVGSGLRAGAAPAMLPGQIIGQVVDFSGSAVPGATIAVRINGQERAAISDANGWYRLPNLPSGSVTITARLSGFKDAQQSLEFNQQGRQIDFQLAVAAMSETVTVMADEPGFRRSERDQRVVQEAAAPSVNVQNLQRRAAGVLPVRVDVPRAGGSYRFVKPLVVDEETVVGFRYKRR